MDSHTRVVAVSWVTYGIGYRTNLPALGKVCRQRGIRLIVDGIQGVGVLATPLAELGADVVIAGGHKALLSHIGAGIMVFIVALFCMMALVTVLKGGFKTLRRKKSRVRKVGSKPLEPKTSEPS